MDRQIVYVGAVPLDTDQLLQSRHTMIGLGYLTKMVVGDDASYADGLSCNPGQGLSVVIGPGSLTSPTVVDAAFIGLLPPNGDPLVKMGINTASVVLSIGGSGSWLISASVAEAQAGDAVVAYYNAAMPTQTLFGPGGNGAAQASVVQQRVALSVSSTPASSGGASSGGTVPLWIVDLPAGATAITSDMISIAPGAPFLPVKLPAAAPLASPTFTGTPNAPTPAVGDVSSLLATTAFVSAASRRARAVWTKAGSYVWTCPSGVSQVLLRGWGPGGAGGIGSGGYPGGGGGGGGYLEVLLDVEPGQIYAVLVGAGGTNLVSSTTTGFGGILSVFGGGNGGNGGAGQSGAGGTAGSDAVLQLEALSNPGASTGQAGYVLGGVGIGGAGGPTFGTGSGHPTIGGTVGAAGLWPGGGGSGGTNGAGGTGASGLLILEWCGNATA